MNGTRNSSLYDGTRNSSLDEGMGNSSVADGMRDVLVDDRMVKPLRKRKSAPETRARAYTRMCNFVDFCENDLTN